MLFIFSVKLVMGANFYSPTDSWYLNLPQQVSGNQNVTYT